MSNPYVLLVGNVSSNIGLGHLTRLLALAQAIIKDYSAQPELLIFGEPIKRDEFMDLKTHFLPISDEFVGSIKNIAKDLNPSVVVFDLHPTQLSDDLGELFVWLKKRGIALVGIDSLVDYYQVLDLVWVPSFYFDSSKIPSCRGKFKSGWDSFLIQKRLPNKRWKPGRRILILTGGGVSTHLDRTLPFQLDTLIKEETEIHWVQGPFSEPPTLPNKTRLKWIVHDAPKQLDELIVKSNYVLTVFGVSFFEVLQYGIPTVVFSPYGDKDDVELIALAKEKVAVVSENPDSAVLSLKQLMNDTNYATKCSQRALKKLSINGTKQLAETVCSFV